MALEQSAGDPLDESELEDDGVLDAADSLNGALGDDVLDAGVDAPDGYSAGERFGTTLAEQRRGESLDQLLAEEEPDIDPYAEEAGGEYDPTPAPGRIIAQRSGGWDDESQLVAHDAGDDGGTSTAEESAMHLVDEDHRPAE